jgi:hypothetical protein
MRDGTSAQWRRHLTPEQLGRFREVLAHDLQYFGYPL